jgi:DNA-binding PadR family transcriptional regulator
MAKFKNLLLVSSDFTKIPNKFLEIFSKDYNEMVVLIRLMNTMEIFNNWGKLQEDKSFYLSLTKMVEMFQGNVSKPTLLKHLDNLEKKGFITKIKSNNPKQANFYIINCKKINKLCDTKTREIFEEDEIPQEPAEEASVVKKNKTVVEKNSEIESVGYNLKPANNKEKSTELAIVAEKESYKDKIKKAWNCVAEKHGLAKIMLVSDVRLRKFKTALKFFKCDEKTFFQNIHQSLSESNFLRGIGKDWKADFDFFITTSRAIKAFEGAYKDNENKFIQKLQNPDTMSFKEAERLRREAQLQELKERCKRQEEEEKQKLIS